MVLDVAYVLVLLGGCLIFRARGAGPPIWVTFGILAVLVGGFLFAATHNAGAAYGAAAASAWSTSGVGGTC